MSKVPTSTAPYPINIRIPDRAIHNKIRRDAKDEGISVSAVIRRIIKRHYEAVGQGAA